MNPVRVSSSLTGHPMKIREARIDEAPGIAAVHTEAWRIAFRGIISDRLIEEWNKTRLERWDTYLRDPNAPAKNLVCEIDGTITGFTLYGPLRDEGADKQSEAELYAMYVHPDLWRRGVAYALWDETLRRFREGGYHHAAVWCLEKNERARRFYERIGFVADGKTKMFERLGETHPEVRYWQTISPA